MQGWKALEITVLINYTTSYSTQQLMQYYNFYPQTPKIGFKRKLLKPKPFATYQVYSMYPQNLV